MFVGNRGNVEEINASSRFTCFFAAEEGKPAPAVRYPLSRVRVIGVNKSRFQAVRVPVDLYFSGTAGLQSVAPPEQAGVRRAGRSADDESVQVQRDPLD